MEYHQAPPEAATPARPTPADPVTPGAGRDADPPAAAGGVGPLGSGAPTAPAAAPAVGGDANLALAGTAGAGGGVPAAELLGLGGYESDGGVEEAASGVACTDSKQVSTLLL